MKYVIFISIKMFLLERVPVYSSTSLFSYSGKGRASNYSRNFCRIYNQYLPIVILIIADTEIRQLSAKCKRAVRNSSQRNALERDKDTQRVKGPTKKKIDLGFQLKFCIGKIPFFIFVSFHRLLSNLQIQKSDKIKNELVLVLMRLSLIVSEGRCRPISNQ